MVPVSLTSQLHLIHKLLVFNACMYCSSHQGLHQPSCIHALSNQSHRFRIRHHHAEPETKDKIKPIYSNQYH